MRPSSSETTSVSGDTDNNPTFEPDSDTDLTEPESRPGPRPVKRRKADTRGEKANRDKPGSSVELLHRTHYEDPTDDTDEDLSKVPEDYGKSKGTKKPKLRLTDC